MPPIPTTTYSEKSSFTANALVLRRAAFTDIPFSREMADILQAANHLSELDKERALSSAAITPFFEARYLMTNRLLDQHALGQVVELAAGFSPRGLAMTSTPAINFIEVDLPETSRLKRWLIDQLVAKGAVPARPNLRLIEGNVTDPVTFTKLEPLLRNEPVAFICEGLLRYVSFPDKQRLACQIRDHLRKFAGIWITPDIELSELASPEQRHRQQRMADYGVDVRPNLFRNEAHAVAFFADLGFTVTSFSPFEVIDQLVSIQRLNLNPEKVARSLQGRLTFLLTPA